LTIGRAIVIVDGNKYLLRDGGIDLVERPLQVFLLDRQRRVLSGRRVNA
jgi:hypothetical protein